MVQESTQADAPVIAEGVDGNGGAKLGHGSGGIVSLRAE